MKHIVGFSGGIDSQACALWVRRQFNPSDVILVNSDPGGNEDALTTEFLGEYSRTVFPVTMVHPIIADMGNFASTKIVELGLKPSDPLTFDLLAFLKGIFPSRKAQFCTEFLKLRPQLRWIKEHFGPGGPCDGEEYERYSGVRRDESGKRKDAAEREWDTLFDCWLNRPLVAWPKKQCFDFVRDAGEPINPLYSLGFSRVGCAPCINSSKDDILNWSKRRPQNIDRIREWEQRVGRTFFHPVGDRTKINFVDDVVAWSGTVHGGKQLGLHVLETPSACSSKYGLCE